VRAGAASVAGCAAAAIAYDDAAFRSVSTQVGGTDYVTLPGGLRYTEVRPGGGGASAAIGDTVAVQLSGRCLNLNGKKFISTQDPAALASGLSLAEPFTFTIGAGAVVPGLEQAVVGMTKGSYRRVVVPQALGYDAAMTLGPIPDNFQDVRSLESIVKNPNRDASLLLDVQLERIKSKK
jgi:FKBP-type peptidyl-prolyl cis-trans isomerase